MQIVLFGVPACRDRAGARVAVECGGNFAVTRLRPTGVRRIEDADAGAGAVIRVPYGSPWQ
jgi:hypothetical protein